MHVTLHLTTGCNMACEYCYSPSTGRKDMSFETATKAVDLATSIAPSNVGVIFFGGEPLLRKDLIFAVIDYCREKGKREGACFHYKVTTNGLLMDPAFIDKATAQRLHVSLSVDGAPVAHNRHRKTGSGEGTFAQIEDRIGLLLSRQPYASALMVVTPRTVGHYAESVRFLMDRGFRYVIASLNYAARWDSEDVRRLEKQYEKIARLYERLTVSGKKFYLSPFEKKLASHIHGKEALCQQCYFGVRQISVGPSGAVYPCVQFVQQDEGDGEYSIGDVSEGIDPTRQQELFARSRQDAEPCTSCALVDRCEHRCSCLNWQTTGAIDQVSATLCATERALIPIVDKLGERLYRLRAPLFIQKHYNPVYPLISFLEDQTP